jgi:hypothetical protein
VVEGPIPQIVVHNIFPFFRSCPLSVRPTSVAGTM